MNNAKPALFAFDGAQRIAAGPHDEVVQKVSAYLLRRPDAQPLFFDMHAGTQIDVDLRGPEESTDPDAPRPGKGRPKLGVVAREITLLPRHWDWLASQPGGASVTLRKLIERANKEPDPRDQQQAWATAAYHFMHAVGGNLPGFEEAARLLFAGNIDGLRKAVSDWPGDIGDQVLALASADTYATWL
jgi:uncharacterized protein